MTRLEAQKKYIAEYFGKDHYLFPKMRLLDNPDFIMGIYEDQIRKIEINQALGQELNPLEKIGLQVLLNSYGE